MDTQSGPLLFRLNVAVSFVHGVFSLWCARVSSRVFVEQSFSSSVHTEQLWTYNAESAERTQNGGLTVKMSTFGQIYPALSALVHSNLTCLPLAVL